MTKLKNIAIALEGGGAKGAYEAGVFKAIKELNIKYNCVAGTSAGAVNAAAFVMDDLDKLLGIWTNLSFSFESIDKKPMPKTFDLSSIIKGNIDEFEHMYLNSKGIDPESTIQMYKSQIDEEKIRKSPIDFGLTTYCLTDRKYLQLFKADIPNGMLAEYVFASCNLPVFTPKSINGKYYLDGGIFQNLPVEMLANRGYENIITVRLRPEEYDFSQYNDLNIIDISPDEFLSGTLDADSERIKWMIEKGYNDAIKILSSYEFESN